MMATKEILHRIYWELEDKQSVTIQNICFVSIQFLEEHVGFKQHLHLKRKQ